MSRRTFAGCGRGMTPSNPDGRGRDLPWACWRRVLRRQDAHANRSTDGHPYIDDRLWEIGKEEFAGRERR